jgi:hypothetical protein
MEEGIRFAVTEHVRAVGGQEGAVLLDLRSGKYFALNGVGGLIWQGIERGEPLAALLSRLEGLEGETETPAGRLRADADAFLSQLLHKGLIRPADAAPPAGAPPEPAPSPKPSVPEAAAGEEAALRLRPLWLPLSWLGLLLADLVLGLLGFHRFHTLLSRIPTRLPERDDPALATALSRVVDRAAAFYFKRAWCLQRSAVTAVLLRLQGVPAKLVIGVHRVPFQAHAWVELQGRVINDQPWLPEAFAVIESC